ncbi:MAG: hypothetical protein KC475_08685 [Cyanobacteria bacterium HKST-UBA03]|nr:hypothetical protein [Cyanobacteria bacterium HKST-UBA03]
MTRPAIFSNHMLYAGFVTTLATLGIPGLAFYGLSMLPMPVQVLLYLSLFISQMPLFIWGLWAGRSKPDLPTSQLIGFGGLVAVVVILCSLIIRTAQLGGVLDYSPGAAISQWGLLWGFAVLGLGLGRFFARPSRHPQESPPPSSPPAS